MKKIILATSIVAITSIQIFAAQPSAFGAGNLDNSTPYGLTSGEKTILQNKDKLTKIVVKSNNQANEVESLRERIDGLQSIVESLSRKAQLNKSTLLKLENNNLEKNMNADEYSKRLSEVIQNNTLSTEKNSLVIKELSSIINTINSNYITKDEFNTLVQSVNEFKSLVVKELKSTPKPKVSSFSTMKNSEIASKAQEFFDTQYYTKGIKYYSYLVEKNYKPAKGNFMLGEMHFKRKNYANAISYYKQSASLYDKASYMPTLMLHTAVSMQKTQDTNNAKAFYNGVIIKFPSSPEAIQASEYLKSL